MHVLNVPLFLEKVGMSFDSVAHSKAGLTDNEAGLSPMEAKMERDQELQEIKEFENQGMLLKWGLRMLGAVLLCTLAFLWIYYR